MPGEYIEVCPLGDGRSWLGLARDVAEMHDPVCAVGFGGGQGLDGLHAVPGRHEKRGPSDLSV